MLDHRIETFLTVCETKNYTRAAVQLSLTQPAVSQHIRYLEEYFNCKLFEMRGKQIHITSKGEEVYQLARLLKLNVEKFKEHLSEDVQDRELCLGATRTIGEYIMPPIISAYLKEYPKNTVQMRVDSANALLEKVRYGELDFAFIEEPFNQSDFNVIEFDEERYIPVCSTDFPLANQKVQIEQLFEYPLILMDGGASGRTEIEQWLIARNHGLESFSKINVVNNIPIVKEMVRSGIGIAFLYESSVKEEMKRGELIHIDIEEYNVTRQFNFVYRKFTGYEDECLEFFDFCRIQRRLLCL